MKRLKVRVRSEEIYVRRDKRHAGPRMTRAGYAGASTSRNLIPPEERTGNWRAWWRFGCGSINGKPVCPDGHAYYIDRYERKAHARAKVLGRRRERRRLNAQVADW